MKHLSMLCAVALLACSSEDSPPVENGGEGGGGGGSPAALPDMAELPVLTPCPDGWRNTQASHEGDVAGCDPWPIGGPVPCEVASAHFPGEPGCTEIGPPCPNGDWSEGLPPGAIFVHAAATAGGDGTQALPYATIAEGLAASSAGSVIALSKGTFDEVVDLPAGVTLWGACARDTLLSASAPHDTAGVVNVDFADGTLRQLRISGERPGIWSDASGASLHVEDIVIASARTLGWLVGAGAQVTGTSVVLRGTRARTSDGTFGRGLDVEGGQLSLTRVYIEDNLEFGVFVSASAHVELTNVAVLTTDVEPGSGTLGRGVQVQQGAELLLTRAAVQANRDAAVVSTSYGTRLVLEDAMLRNTLGVAEVGGTGLLVLDGALAELNRVELQGNRDSGVLGMEEGSLVKLTDVLVIDTQGQSSDGTMGRGIDIERGADVELSRVLVDANREMGVYGIGEGTLVTGSDVTVRDTLGRLVDGGFGRGLGAESGAVVEIERLVLVRNTEVAVLAGLPGSRLTLSHVRVADTFPSGGRFGRGFSVQHGASLFLSHALVERSLEAGVYAIGPFTTVTLEDVTVRDTVANAEGAFGDGVVALTSDVALAGCRIENSARAGVTCFAGTTKVGSTTFACNPIDLDSEGLGGTPCTFEDLGGNTCGCHSATKACKVLSTALEPPGELGAPR